MPSVLSTDALRQALTHMRVNIGCGMTPTTGWENFDNSLSLTLSHHPYLASLLFRLKVVSSPQMDYILFCQKHPIKWANATKHIPLPNDSVDVLYSSHMLEHLDRSEARRFLSEAMRVLKSGGIIRLALPDLSRLVERYNQDNDANAFVESTLMCVPNPRRLFQRFHVAFVGNRHHLWMYDGKSLSELLVQNGFAHAKILASGETTIAEPKPLNLSERRDVSVYVEASKP